MPRNFLAPYKFELIDLNIEDLRNYLTRLIDRTYEDTNDLTRIKCKSVNTKQDAELGDLIYGTFEYGKYGTKRIVIDEKGIATKEIEENESPMDNYFYVFNFITPNRGYLILQRIGNIGVRKAMGAAINNMAVGGRINITPIILGIRDLLERREILDITIEVPEIPRLIDEKLERVLSGTDYKNEVKHVSISLKAQKNRSFSKEIIQRILQIINNRDFSNVGYIMHEKEVIKLRARVGKSIRTINITSKKIRSWIEIEDDEDIFEKSRELLKNIIEEEEGNVQNV